MCLQETYAYGALQNEISFEFPGYWINSTAQSSHSTGAAVGVFNTRGLDRRTDDDYVDDEGRIAGMALVTDDGTQYYIISAYAPCCTTSTQHVHYKFLCKLSTLMFDKRSKGYKVILGGDLNCIRDASLDSKNGGEVFYKQSDWFNQLEAAGDYHDLQRFHAPDEVLVTWSHGKRNTLKRFRCLDYFIAPKSILERTRDVRVIPTISDHCMICMKIEARRSRIKGINIWKIVTSLTTGTALSWKIP
jgi:exonuclease III